MPKMREEFQALKDQRWIEGAAEYGAFGFIQNDMVRFAIEEIADLANYAEMLYIKLRIMERKLDANSNHTP